MSCILKFQIANLRYNENQFPLGTAFLRDDLFVPMNVIGLTLLVSLLLASLFLCLFLLLHRRNSGSPEQDSLMPLRDDDSHTL